MEGARPMRKPCLIPSTRAATKAWSGWLQSAWAHASAFRGVAMGLSVTAGGTPWVPAIGWCGPACSLQNCLAAMGAITAEVEWGMLVEGPLVLGTGQSGMAEAG